MTALLFSGQGSQYVGMMRDLAAEFPEAAQMLAQADVIMAANESANESAQAITQRAFSAICFDGPADTLKETRYTQPALFVHEAILTTLLRDKLSSSHTAIGAPIGAPISAVAGHSLGEYSALFAAGVVDFETALRLVKLRGELMFRAGEHEPGTMAAVVGLDDDSVRAVCERLHDPDHNSDRTKILVAANFNSPGQVVISGSADYLRANMAAFKTAGAKLVKELPVSGAFHSPLMEGAKAELARAIEAAAFHDATVDVYANALAKPLRAAAELKSALVQQLVAPVLWTQSLVAMRSAGITTFYELGPGTVLQGLVKRTVEGADVSISGFDTAAQVQAALA
jgi:[acyl-carrier-protein] S-malonyltransferase